MEFIITQDFHEVRLDRFLRKKYREIPMSGIFRMIRKKRIKVNGKRKKHDYRLQEGDVVRVWESSAPTAAKQLLHLTVSEKQLVAQSIVHEDENILLFNKPSGLVMHVGSGHKHGLTEMAQAHMQNPELSFVHRIDKMTSGLVMAAKNQATSRKLSELIREQAVEKYYAVLVEGVIKEDHFQLRSLLKKEDDRVKTHHDRKNGAKQASSDFSVLERGPERTLLKARLLTGRTHQLRVQLAEINHAIVGDPKYGRKGEDQMFLFSQHLIVSFYGVDFSLPLPESFHRALRQTPSPLKGSGTP